MPTELHRDTVFLLRNIVTLANIVERIKLHHQMVHAIARPLRNGETVVSAVDVHEIQRHRRTHEIRNPEAQQGRTAAPAFSNRAASASSAVASATSQPKNRSPSVNPPSTIRRCFRSSMRNARVLPPRSTG